MRAHFRFHSCRGLLCGVLLGAYCLTAVQLFGCVRSYPESYTLAKAAGHRALSSGRYEEAAGHFHQAAADARRRRDKDYALYLEAETYLRAGKYLEARSTFETILAESPNGLESPRSAYEIAKLEIRFGDERNGWDMVHAAVKRYPNSGLARTELIRYLEYVDASAGLSSTVEFLESKLSWYESHELGETATFEIAKRLEKLGRMKEAHDRYLSCARNHPYPKGALFDDAMYRVSLLDESMGRPKEAVGHLREMLAFREVSSLNWSYERRRFPEAQMRIAVLYRDALGQPDEARREFRKVFLEHKDSTLRDDALWAEALVAVEQGDERGACETVKLLASKLPESRYVPCVGAVCKKMHVPQKAEKKAPIECRDYIARGVAPRSHGGPQRSDSKLDDHQ